jgi:hypothetical protein
MTSRSLISLALSAVLVMAGGLAQADGGHRGGASLVYFKIENLTHAITFRPFLIAVHGSKQSVFSSGEPASLALQTMAECGAVDLLAEALSDAGADVVANPVNEAQPFDPPLGLLFPAGTTAADTAVPFEAGLPGEVSGSFVVHDRRNTKLSVVAMLLPTNDGFAGLDSASLPERGKRTFYLNAYDAGTENNNEVMSDDNPLDCVPDEPGYPVDPLGNTGSGGSGEFDFEASDRVHVHRGNVGDADPTGGFSDLDSRIHRWLNPVVKVTVWVRPLREQDH